MKLPGLFLGLGLAVIGFAVLAEAQAVAAPHQILLPIVHGLPPPNPTPTTTPSPTPSPATQPTAVSGQPIWPMQGRSPSRTGQSPVNGPQINSMKWVAPEHTTDSHYNASQPAIGADGSIYLATSDRILYSFKPDGSLNWRLTTGVDSFFAPAIGTSGAVYAPILDSAGRTAVGAISFDGTLDWTYTFPGDPGSTWVTSALAIGTNGEVYVPVSLTGGGAIYALSQSAQLLWSKTLPGSAVGVALAPDGTVYVASSQDGLYAFTSSGSQKWRYPTTFLNDALPMVAPNGTVYVATGDGSIDAISSSGVRLWEDTAVRASGAFANGPMALGTDGTIYFGSIPWLYALSSDGTTINWKFDAGTDLFGAFPIVGSDGTIYLASGSCSLFVLRMDGVPKWTQQGINWPGLTSSCPDGSALGSDGTLYVGLGSGQGLLAAFRP